MRQPKKKHRAKTWILLLLVAGILFLFRKSVLIGVVKIALAYSLSGNNSFFTYETIQWENDVIRIDDISYANRDAQILIDQVNIVFSGTPFSWHIDCKVFHPEINVKPGGSSPVAPVHVLLQSHYPKVFWEIYDGIVRLDDNPPLYFNFLPDEAEHRLGKIALSYLPHSDSFPLLTASLEKKEDAVEIEFSLIEEDCSRLLPIAQALFPQLPKQWEQTQGKMDASGRMRVDLENNFSLVYCRWNIDELVLECQSSGIELLANHLSGALESISLLPLDQLWQQAKGRLLFKQAQFYMSSLVPHRFILENAEIVLEPEREPYLDLIGSSSHAGISLPITIHAEGQLHSDTSFFLGIDARCGSAKDLQLHASVCRFEESKFAMELKFTHLLREYLAFFAPQLPFVWPQKEISEGNAILLYENGIWQAEAEMAFGQEKIICGALLDDSFHLKEGWFETEKLTALNYSPIIELVAPDIILTGELSVKGNFDPSYCVVSLQGFDCVIQHTYGDLFLPTLGENGAEIIYNVKEKKLRGEISLEDAKWCNRNPEGLIHSLNALVHLDGENIYIPSFAAQYKGIALQGKIESLYFDPLKKQIAIEKINAEWTLPDGTQLSLKSPSCVIDYTEELTCNFHLLLDHNHTRVLELAGIAQPKDFSSWNIGFDRQRTRFLNTDLNISRLHISKERTLLEMRPVFSCEELFTNLKWLSSVGLLCLPEAIDKDLGCQGSLQTLFSTQDLNAGVHFKIESKDIAYKGKKIAPFAVRGQCDSERILIEECKGEGFAFKAHCGIKEHSLHVSDLEGQWGGVFLKASADLELATRTFTISLDSLKGNTAFFLPAGKGINGNFSAHGSLRGRLSPALQLSGDAICTLDLIKPLSITAWNVKPLKISYVEGSGLSVEELSVFVKGKKEASVLGLFSCDKCFIAPELALIEAKACHFSGNSVVLKEFLAPSVLPSVLKELVFPEKLEVSGDIQMGSEGFTCHAQLKDGAYGIKDTVFALQKVGMQCERGVFTVQAKTQVGEQTLWGALSVALTKNPQAILRITDDPRAEGIRGDFRFIDDQLQWEKIYGTCLGLQCSLAKSSGKKCPGASVLTGHVFVDASRVPSLLSPAYSEKFAQYKPGAGYSWQGDLVLWQDTRRGFEMTGQVNGKEWELLGYRFQSLSAGIDVHPAHIRLFNIHIEDEAGTIAIKKIDIEKKDHWQLSIPIVSIREWHPSSMRKIGSTPTVLKPFLIRNFTLSNIHADLERPESLEGRGKLTFTNQCKKESTLFDTPLELIKNFGLDPGLLTPVQGEIDIDLQGDKMYLVGMKEVFSEAKRSEFYLALGKELSYIDLSGKIRIDLKMHQDVMLKITEPFVLTIRGTLESPRYGLNLLP